MDHYYQNMFQFPLNFHPLPQPFLTNYVQQYYAPEQVFEPEQYDESGYDEQYNEPGEPGYNEQYIEEKHQLNPSAKPFLPKSIKVKAKREKSKKKRANRKAKRSQKRSLNEIMSDSILKLESYKNSKPFDRLKSIYQIFLTSLMFDNICGNVFTDDTVEKEFKVEVKNMLILFKINWMRSDNYTDPISLYEFVCAVRALLKQCLFIMKQLHERNNIQPVQKSMMSYIGNLYCYLMAADEILTKILEHEWSTQNCHKIMLSKIMQCADCRKNHTICNRSKTSFCCEEEEQVFNGMLMKIFAKV